MIVKKIILINMNLIIFVMKNAQMKLLLMKRIIYAMSYLSKMKEIEKLKFIEEKKCQNLMLMKIKKILYQLKKMLYIN